MICFCYLHESLLPTMDEVLFSLKPNSLATALLPSCSLSPGFPVSPHQSWSLLPSRAMPCVTPSLCICSHIPSLSCSHAAADSLLTIEHTCLQIPTWCLLTKLAFILAVSHKTFSIFQNLLYMHEPFKHRHLQSFCISLHICICLLI